MNLINAEAHSSPEAKKILSAHGHIDDKFFQKFSYEDTVKHERWRRA